VNAAAHHGADVRGRGAAVRVMASFLVAILAGGCGAGTGQQVEVDLTAAAACVVDGTWMRVPREGEDASRRLVQGRPGTIDFYLRLPAESELRFALAPPVASEKFRVTVEQDGSAPVVLPLRQSGQEWQAPLDGLDGEAVRLRFENRSGAPLAWLRPRVVGARRERPPIVGASVRPSETPINVLLYVVDALRADHLSLYGYERPTSPNIDRMAERGVVFRNAYAPGPNTGTSIPALFASRYPSELGGRLRTTDGASRLTLAQAFRDAGFATAAFQANFWLLRSLGFAHGFDTYDVLHRKTEKGPKPEDAGVVHRRVLDWVKAHTDQPFFLYVQSMDVHDPYDPPPPFLGKFSTAADGGASAPPIDLSGLSAEVRPQIRQLIESLRPERYDDAVAYADHAIGELVDALEDIGVADRTAIVITADHGESLGGGGRFLHGHSLLEELVHIPLVMILPWHSGRIESDAIVSLLDLGPTLLDLAGIPVPSEFAGRSVFGPYDMRTPPFVVGERIPTSKTEPTSWYAREGSWKLRMNGEDELLFDLESERSESVDRSDDRPVIAGYLGSLVREQSPALRRGEPGAPGFDIDLDPTERKELYDALRALGYVE
jgi:arylsulfatase A-like enzyme